MLRTLSKGNHMEMNNVHLFDEFEYEDDVFYHELRRQVLQLTSEEDDEEDKNQDVVRERKRGVYNGPCGGSQEPAYYNYWAGNKEDFAAPPWMLNLWRTGNGTGVFIPQIVQSKRKNRSRRRKNERGRTYNRVEKI